MSAAGGTVRRRAAHSVVAAALALVVLGLAGLGAVEGLEWWGRPFPGFFVLANRLVPVAALPDWSAGVGDVFLAEVTAVAGVRVRDNGDVYRQVALRPPGTPIAYTFRRDGRTWEATFVSRRFGGSEALLLFGAYALNGLVFGLVAITVWVLRPDLLAARGNLVLGLTTAVYALTGALLYGAHPLALRLNVLAESLWPAAVVHFAFAFPRPHLAARRRLAVALAWGASLAIAAVFQAVVFDIPRAVPVGNLCFVNVGGVLFVFAWRMWREYRRGTPLERTKIRVVVLAAVPGVVFPAILFTLSGVTGGQLSVTSAAFTAFLFPLGLAYAIVRHDLFEIDTMVRRLVHWVVLTGVTMLLYSALLAAVSWLLHQPGSSDPLPLHLSLAGVVVLLLPLRDRVQRIVDRVCFRPTYDARGILEATSVTFASTLDVARIAAIAVERADEALCLEAGALYLREPGGAFRAAGVHRVALGGVSAVAADHPAIARLAEGRAVAWYDDDAALGAPPPLGSVTSELLVPMTFRDGLLGFLALGPRRSRRYYAGEDVQFLRTLASQTAISILHARSYEELHSLTVTLEQKVVERTAELNHANAELREAVARQSGAYRELQQSQEKLIRAEKLATLGRLAAGVAHEVSTPLGAALASLRVARELIQEYAASIGDPSVGLEDHRELARELDTVARRAEQWTEKAAHFILAVKAHTRGCARTPASTFDVNRVVRETEVLLQHQLRAASCALRVAVDPATPQVRGDPTKLGQILTNLVTNGIDAYEEAGRTGQIDVRAAREGDGVTITVSDWGCGIATEHLAHVWEELFTTKPPGRGTGLGLAIVRDLVTNHFGGTITVDSTRGVGTTFTITLPAAAEPSARTAA
ncbi:MAG TPA: ATP-binding protein [Candidatus Binatia bacterium]|nr:ATP-binding protein [Candidatus Binatia bacterium]